MCLAWNVIDDRSMWRLSKRVWRNHFGLWHSIETILLLCIIFDWFTSILYKNKNPSNVYRAMLFGSVYGKNIYLLFFYPLLFTLYLKPVVGVSFEVPLYTTAVNFSSIKTNNDLASHDTEWISEIKKMFAIFLKTYYYLLLQVG